MANRVESIAVGVGSLSEVREHWSTSLSQDGETGKKFDNFSHSLENMVADPATRPAALAAICAVLNSDLGKTGWLFSVNKNALVNVSYVSDEPMRNTMVALMSD